MQDLILFDIDGTLFNPQAFGKKIRARFTDILNIGEEELISANADYYAGLETTTDFNPRDITVFLAERFNVEPTLLDAVFWEEDGLFLESLFEDAREALEHLSGEKTLGIFSQGFEELQKRKLSASGIEKYFEREYMFFHRRKISDEALTLLPKAATVIDDSHEVVAKIAPLVTSVWINRRTQDKDDEIRTIHTLREF